MLEALPDIVLMLPLDAFDRLFPLACRWAAEEEKFILQNGVPLTDDQKIDAYLIGVKNIEEVRLFKSTTIPSPSDPVLKEVTERINLLTNGTIGLSLNYGIYIREDCWNERKLIAHELVHTMQYERLGGIEAFLRQYLTECIFKGYPNGALEQEAIKVADEICKR